MEIVYKKLEDLRPYSKNPRKNDMAVEPVMNSIREFGFKVPIVIDGNGEIVAGHTRYKAAQKLGLTEVPCIVADDLSPEQIKAFRLADNKVSEAAVWDDDLLGPELGDIFDIDMSAFGFDLGEDEKRELKDVDVFAYQKMELIVDCETEDAAQKLYEELTNRGYSCRLSTL